MRLKLLIFFAAALIVTSYADDTCAALYRKMKKTIQKQKTKVCRVTGIGEERTDIMGFFFDFNIQGKRMPAVLIYGTDYEEMLYMGDDYYVKEVYLK